MQTGMLRKAIGESFQRGDLAGVQKQIEEYEACCPEDIELVTIKTNYYIQINDLEQALKFAKEGERRLPLNGDVQYNLAYVLELCGALEEAAQHYFIADYLFGYDGKEELREELDISRTISGLMERLQQECQQCEEVEEKARRVLLMKNLLELGTNGFGAEVADFRMTRDVIGKMYVESLAKRRYAGIYEDQSAIFGLIDDKDLLHIKAEFLEAEENVEYIVSESEESEDTEYMLPIALKKEAKAEHSFFCGGESLDVAQLGARHFNYYRVKNHTSVFSSEVSYYGKPIKLKTAPDKKKLVLSIFVDGLSDTVLKEDFQKHMPNTYKYFQKGTIFDRVYTAAEWTYPGIINIVTGLSTVHHMNFHNKIDYWMPHNVPTLAETFQEEGYYTAIFNGDWRIIPPYGHARGYDRFVWQHQWSGLRVEEVICDAINHIEAFQETNQYVWISIGDLHDIADMVSLPITVQKNLDLKSCSIEKGSATSVKQSYSENKKRQYLQQAAHIDRWLKILFRYIEENYDEQEVVVSLFADHGQGFLKPNDAHFLAKERANIAFMFRGGEAEGKGKIQELVSSCDYGYIMRELSGIRQPRVRTDGRIPGIFGSGAGREYALTESIHPEDPYYAAIYAEKETFFFTNPEPVQTDGRFRLGEYECYLEDSEGIRLENEKLKEYYLKIVMEHIAPILIYE